MNSESKITGKAWQLWHSMFKDGDEVVLEDDNGEFHFGRIFTKEDGIELARPEGTPLVNFKWCQIVFIAQDGFPVKEIMGMSYEDAVNLCDSLPTELIRKKLIQLVAESNKKTTKNAGKEIIVNPQTSYAAAPDRRRRIVCGGGCPFVFDDVYVDELLYPGNNGPRFWGEDNEETLILRAQNGARMLSYDLAHLFFFDGLEKQFDIALTDRPMNHIQKVW